MRDIRLTTLMLILLLTPRIGQAQSLTPREQFQQNVADLQKNPGDRQLREKIIQLAQELKPPPAIPEEARRHYVKADTLIHDAKNPQDAGAAVEEYNKALLDAPWWPDAYRNLGVTLEVAGRYDDAKKALQLYLLSHPAEDESRKTQDEIYRIEAKEEKAEKEAQIAALAEKQKQQEEIEKNEKIVQSLGGNWVWKERTTNWENWTHYNLTVTGRSELELRFLSMSSYLMPEHRLQEGTRMVKHSFRLSVSGRKLTGTVTWGGEKSLYGCWVEERTFPVTGEISEQGDSIAILENHIQNAQWNHCTWDQPAKAYTTKLTREY